MLFNAVPMYLSTNAGNLASSAFALAPGFSSRNVWNILLPAMSVCDAINVCKLPPFIEMKNRTSIWVGFFDGLKTPVTVNEVSPLVLLLILIVLFKALSLPKSFWAISSLITTVLGTLRQVLGLPSINW